MIDKTAILVTFGLTYLGIAAVRVPGLNERRPPAYQPGSNRVSLLALRLVREADPGTVSSVMRRR